MVKRLGVCLAATAILCACGEAQAVSTAPRTHAQADEAQNGATIALHRGDTLTVTLHSTYWTIHGSTSPDVLLQHGPQTTSPEPPSSHRCVPGQGCGTVSEDFLAIGDGAADVTASRTSCGEALRCTPAQSSWLLHVAVTG